MDFKGYQGYQGYKEQGINEMSQGELLLLLYDELVKRLLRAGLALDKKDYALFEASVDRSLDIIRYTPLRAHGTPGPLVCRLLL